MAKAALVIVDVQNDFLPGGALAVRRGDEIVSVINRIAGMFDLVLATKDWHPANHGSFASTHPGHKPGDVINLNGLEQILWPVHCVQGTPGAELSPNLDQSRIARIFHKGIDAAIDSYSTFFDNAHRRSTGLGEYLKQAGVSTVYLAGLATDYCVLYSALDARHLGLDTFVIEDACRGINLQPGDVDRALQQMRDAGAVIITSRLVGKASDGR